MSNELTIGTNPNDLLPVAQADLDDAGRINYYNDLAKAAGAVSIKAAIGAGLELRRIQEEMPGEFVRWIGEHCHFSKSTAYNYIALAGSLLAGRPSEEIREVRTMDAMQRAGYVSELSGEADGRSLSALYADYGIVRRSRMGGRREGAGRKRKIDACLSMDERAEMATVELEHLIGALGEFFQRRKHLYIHDKDRQDVCRMHLLDLADLLK